MDSGSKFVVNVAYTTPSGRMHIGHGLGHTVSDVILRYEALKQEKDSFFGFGMHSTGKDLIKIIETLKDEDNLPQILKRYNIPQKKRDELLSLPDLEDQVDTLVQEYESQYKEVIKKMGIAMDFDSFFSTNQEANQKYTQWTLKKLNDSGLIVETESERPYCAKCDDIKHIDIDLSEVSSVGQVKWDEVRIQDGELQGGKFECRLHSGEPITVKKRKERAINYADEETQNKVLKLIKNMKVRPNKYKENLEEIVKTRLPKPFERNSEGNIGATSPFDPDKKVEALSDSNIYMEFYGISQLINNQDIKIDNLTDEFFDYVYLNKGNPADVAKNSNMEETDLIKAKKHVQERIPVDVSVLGFEHLGVHLPFSLFTHAAVFPDNYFFPECVVTSHITKKGEKMSKSKGNVVYLDDLLDLSEKEVSIKGLSKEASYDSIRFFLSYYQSMDQDFDWDDSNFIRVSLSGMKRHVSSIRRSGDIKQSARDGDLNYIDKWFSTLDQITVDKITEKMDERDSRKALVELTDIRTKALNNYLTSESPKKEILSSFLKNQISMGYPVLPRVSEELRKEYIPNEQITWPKTNEEMKFFEEYERGEHEFKGKDYEKNIVGDLNSKIGRMMGKKEIKPGDSLEILTPTQYQSTLLQKLKSPFSGKFDMDFQQNQTYEEIMVRKKL